MQHPPVINSTVVLLLVLIAFISCATNLVDKRPPVNQRTFISPAVENVIANITSLMKDQDLASLFLNCYPNTLDTTIKSFQQDVAGRPDTFVVTGDIPAMWLRDSTSQLWLYLPLVNQDKNLKEMMRGVIFRQAKSLLIDSYANAFQYDDAEPSPWATDIRIPKMQNALWEGKYELDSIVHVIKFSMEYYYQSGDQSILQDNIWQSAMKQIVSTIIVQQRSTADDVPPAYYFRRPGEMVVPNPVARTGMSKSFFRPSDDYSEYLFPIAANAMAVVELKKLAQVWRTILKHEDEAKRCEDLAHEINVGILKYGITKDKEGKPVLGYEVDGLGNQTRMDDANVPSLLSLPYLGYLPKNDSLYLRTRSMILSTENPYYYVGTAAKGIGSPHTYAGWIWPISLIQQALTSTSDEEISECLEMIKVAGKVSYFMHESFDMDDPSQFTRSWFAWANSLYGELVLTLAKEKPHLIF